jgi:hypothetical protein
MVYDNAFENDIPSDALDAMADLAYEQRQAMMEEPIEPPVDFYSLPEEYQWSLENNPPNSNDNLQETTQGTTA